MKKKMKNLINVFTIILLAFFVILIPILFNRKENLDINNHIRNKNENSVCKVEDIYYDSLQKAINDNSDNSVFEIIADINEQIKINNRLITIEGNNHKIIVNELTDNLGAIDVKDSTISIRNLIFEGNEKVKTGLFISSSDLYLENVKFNKFVSDEEKLPNGFCIYFLNEKSKSNVLIVKESNFKNFSSAAIYIDNKNKNENEIIPVVRLSIVTSFFESINTEPSIGLVIMGNVKGSITDNCFKNMNVKKSYAIYQNTSYDSIFYLKNKYFNVYQSIYQEIKN